MNISDKSQYGTAAIYAEMYASFEAEKEMSLLMIMCIACIKPGGNSPMTPEPEVKLVNSETCLIYKLPPCTCRNRKI
jgi:hypothetical protein